jgi:hypothetical protein
MKIRKGRKRNKVKSRDMQKMNKEKEVTRMYSYCKNENSRTGDEGTPKNVKHYCRLQGN